MMRAASSRSPARIGRMITPGAGEAEDMRVLDRRKQPKCKRSGGRQPISARSRRLDQREDFAFGQDPRGLFRGGENAINNLVSGRNAALFEPKDDIGAAAQWADLDHLLEAEKMRGHAAVNGIRELQVAFFICL